MAVTAPLRTSLTDICHHGYYPAQAITIAVQRRRNTSFQPSPAFASLQRDGNSEGAFILDRLQTEIEATEIRHVLAIHKRPVITEDHLDAFRQRFSALSMAPSHADLSAELPVTA